MLIVMHVPYFLKIEKEMQRIVGMDKLISKVKIKWDMFKEKIIERAAMEAIHNTRLRGIITTIKLESGML